MTERRITISDSNPPKSLVTKQISVSLTFAYLVKRTNFIKISASIEQMLIKESFVRILLLMAITSIPIHVFAEAKNNFPLEVIEYMKERDLCDHFRGEPYEGDPERRNYVADSLEIYCAGTDRRLKALKRRYKNDEGIITSLSTYEQCVELNCGELR